MSRLDFPIPKAQSLLRGFVPLPGSWLDQNASVEAVPGAQADAISPERDFLSGKFRGSTKCMV